MAKDIFDDSAKRANIFDSIKFNSKNKISSSDTDSNFNKNSKKSNHSNSFRENQSKLNELILKEVHETGGVNQNAKLHVPHYHHPNGPTPAMYKIALKLKRLTEVKLKKTHSGSGVVTEKLVKDEHEEQHTITTASVAVVPVADNKSSHINNNNIKNNSNNNNSMNDELKNSIVVDIPTSEKVTLVDNICDSNETTYIKRIKNEVEFKLNQDDDLIISGII